MLERRVLSYTHRRSGIAQKRSGRRSWQEKWRRKAMGELKHCWTRKRRWSCWGKWEKEWLTARPLLDDSPRCPTNARTAAVGGGGRYRRTWREISLGEPEKNRKEKNVRQGKPFPCSARSCTIVLQGERNTKDRYCCRRRGRAGAWPWSWVSRGGGGRRDKADTPSWHRDRDEKLHVHLPPLDLD